MRKIRNFLWLGSRRGGVVRGLAIGAALMCSMLAATSNVIARNSAKQSIDTSNPSGLARTISSTGSIDQAGPFFQSLGTNGRACVTCHVPSDGWSITPPNVQQRFEATSGLDPLFRTVDGSNSPSADVSTVEARRLAYSMLLNKGLIRIGLGIPANAEFTLVAVDDPYGFASSSELSLFRRPLPTTNLNMLTAVMWDGRVMAADQSIRTALLSQANDATLAHAQGIQTLTDLQRQQIVDFQNGLFSAQIFDNAAGELHTQGAKGGPDKLSKETFYFGINDPFVVNPPFDAVAFTNFGAWAKLKSNPGNPSQVAARQAVARGEQIFNSRRFTISGVRGLNDLPGLVSFEGTCTVCHNTPNVGNHSVPLPIDIGIADAARRTPDMPLYTLSCVAGPLAGQVFQTTDPGRALVTGKCADISKFKGPILRNLASRAPYFHNGSAATLADVVLFYNQRFNMGLNPGEVADLVAFLQVQ